MSSGSLDSVSSGGRQGARSRARPGAIQWLILCGAALVIAIALGTGYLALQFRERALEVSERELNNSALLLSRHFDQQLTDLQHVHNDVVAHMQAGRVDSAEAFERQMSTLAAHEMLRTRLAGLVIGIHGKRFEDKGGTQFDDSGAIGTLGFVTWVKE